MWRPEWEVMIKGVNSQLNGWRGTENLEFEERITMRGKNRGEIKSKCREVIGVSADASTTNIFGK